MEIYYPESIRAVSPHLSYFIGDEIGQPTQFNANFPVLIQQVIDFYRTIHAMHGRALEVLGENREHGRQFCLYLRSFAAGGARFPVESHEAGSTQRMGWTGLDEHIRKFVSEVLEDTMPVVSCLNTLDIRTLSLARKQPTPPAVVRLLSHNWIRTISALIDRAQCVVMLFSAADGKNSEGLQVERIAVANLGQAQRTISIFASEDNETQDEASDRIHRIFSWPAWIEPEEASQAREFAQLLRALASDGYRRTALLPATEDPPCFVVDKNYEASRFESGELSEADYARLVPPDLEPNSALFQEFYPVLLQGWTRIESDLESRRLDIEDIANGMYAALRCFVLAATLEAYEPMARTLATIAKSHYVITRTTEIAVICAGGARDFARLAGDDELATYFGAMEADLRTRSHDHK